MPSNVGLMRLVRPGTVRIPGPDFAEFQGQIVGYGFWLGVLGVIPIALHVRGLNEAGLYLITMYFPFAVVLAVAAHVMLQQALLLTRWRRWVVIVAMCGPSLSAFWLGTPIERWAGLPQDRWDRWSFTTCVLVCAIGGVAMLNAKAAEIRFAPGSGETAKSLRWYDERIGYLAGRIRLSRLQPRNRAEAERQARGSLGHLLMARFQHPDGGSLIDVAVALAQFERAVVLTPEDAPDAATVRFELYRAKFAFEVARVADPEHDEAIAIVRGIVDGWSDRMPAQDRGFALASLAMLESARHLLALRDGDRLPDGAEAELRRDLDRLEALAPEPGERFSDWLAAQMLLPVGQFYVSLGYLGGPRGVADGPDERRIADLGHGIAVLERTIARATTADPAVLGIARAHLALGLVKRHTLRRDGPSRETGRRTADVGRFDTDADRSDADAELAAAADQLLAALGDPLLLTTHADNNIEGNLGAAVVAARDYVDAELARGRWDAALRVGVPALQATQTLFDGAVFDVNVHQALGYWQGLHDSVAYASIRRADHEDRRSLVDVVSVIEWGRATRLMSGLANAHADNALPPSTSAEDRAAWIALVKQAREAEADHYAPGITTTTVIEGLRRDEQLRIKREMQELRGRINRDVARVAVESAAGQTAGTAPEADSASRAKLDIFTTAAAGAPLCYLVHLPTSRVGAAARLPGLAVLVHNPPGSSQPDIKVLDLPALNGPAVARWSARWRANTDAIWLRDLAAPAYAGNDDSRAAAVDDLLRELGTDVMQPILAAAGHPDRLVLAPDALLGLLPFHAAYVVNSRGEMPQPACVDTVITYAPSAQVLNLCRAAAREASGGRWDEATAEAVPQGSVVFPTDFLGIAAPARQLPEAGPEVSSCAAYFEHTEILGDTGVRPSRSRVLLALNEPPRGPRVVHFACHGLVD